MQKWISCASSSTEAEKGSHIITAQQYEHSEISKIRIESKATVNGWRRPENMPPVRILLFHQTRQRLSFP